jgi:flagellar basal body rod protein FlgG
VKTDGIASAASAMRYWELRQEVTANNLANASTDGFKAERVFARLLAGELPAPEAATDTRHGTLRPTGNTYDLSLGGDGFFVVQTPEGERWTRGGAWRLDAEGYLADNDGNRVLGSKDAIRISYDSQGRPLDVADVTIDAKGTVRVNQVAFDTLRVERGVPGASLQHEGSGRYLPDAARQAVTAGARDVRQGFVEESNVNHVASLVEMISINRNYAFAQKVLTTLDGIRATIANDLAKPA